jgi:two-component system, NtrC family, nitrogen regulation sensor histidine kinase GlnL
MRKPSSALPSLWQEIVDSLGDAVLAFDLGLVPIAMNPAAETLFGASHLNSTAIAETLRHNQWLVTMIKACLKSGQNLTDAEARLNVGRRTVLVTAEAAPMLGTGDACGGVVVLIHDLSLHRRAEQALGTVQPDIRLSPAGLAHEVKNPLTGIKGATELLAARVRSDPRGQQYCGLILDGVNRIASLVEQVLAVSAPQRLQFAPTNIHRVLHQALAMAGLHPQPPSGVTVEQVFDPSLPEISADAGTLERVFLNLVRNAAEAIGHSGTIRLCTRIETEFRLTAEGRSLQFLRVEISDSGRGMNPEEMAQLFTPFFTTKPSGTGLGLVLSQRIIAAHGGKLWAEAGGVARAGAPRAAHPGDSTPARGMTFKVTLPVGPREPDPAEAA